MSGTPGTWMSLSPSPGLGLALQSWVALLAILVAAGALLALRVRNEERFLAAELGDGYVTYMRRTKRFLPFIW